MPLMLILISCTKELNISDLKGEEGVAIHPDTGEPYSGKAYLNFFDGNIRMKGLYKDCLLYTSPSPRDGLLSRMPSSA